MPSFRLGVFFTACSFVSRGQGVETDEAKRWSPVSEPPCIVPLGCQPHSMLRLPLSDDAP